VFKKEDSRAPAVPANFAGPGTPTVSPSAGHGGSREPSAALPVSAHAAACISHGIRIKGEITGSEDLFVDGVVEGKLNLANGSLTIGPNGSVNADVSAREVIVRGRLEGKISGRERVQLWSTGHVLGEVQTQRLAIEDGATLRGKVETGGKLPDKNSEARAAVTSSPNPSSSGKSVSSGTAAANP
jgi:cytoskeletal protein CcmA (bactofilin family)